MKWMKACEITLILSPSLSFFVQKGRVGQRCKFKVLDVEDKM